MVNIAIIGASFEGITFIKFLTRYISEYDIGFNIVKYDVEYKRLKKRQERYIQLNEKETKTIHPARLVIREKSGSKAHTIFAPGGDISRAVVKMGVITFSRIATVIIAYFSLNKPLKEQFAFFNEVRFFPDEIYIWLLEREKLDVNREEIIEHYTSSITDFFQKRKIKIKKNYMINIEFMFEILNNRALQSIFEIIKEEDGSIAQKPIKRDDYTPTVIEKEDFKILELFNATQKYVFLVGAGVSINKPSNIPPAQEIVEKILKNCSPKGKYEDLKKLQYELVIEYLHKYLDKDLIFMDLFEENYPPNLIHFFLANAILNGHDVITTNFDYLIEKALLIVSNSKPKKIEKKNKLPDTFYKYFSPPKFNFKVIITKKDYIQCKESNSLKNQNLRFLFKIHGSKKNIIEDKSIDETIITSISSLIKNKDISNLFEIESYKKEIIEQIITNRTLIVMGYSGSDEFDISPLLRLFPQLNSLIWVAHSNESISIVYKVNPLADPTIIRNRENKLLVEISNSVWYEVIKLEMNTEMLCEILWNLFFPHAKIPYISKEAHLDLESWFSSKYSSIDELSKYDWVARLYYDMGNYNDALNVVIEGYNLAKKANNKGWKNIFQDQIGLIYIKLKDYEKAINIFTMELNDSNFRKNPERLSNIFSYLGLINAYQRKFNEALEYYQKALKINNKQKNYERVSQIYNNIGKIYKKAGNYEVALSYYQKALDIDQKHENLRIKANSFMRIAALYKSLKLDHESIKYFEISFKIFTDLADIVQMIKILNNLAEIFIEIKNFDKAIENVQQGLKLTFLLGNKDLKRKILSNMSSLEQILLNKN
ncbi:MAG: tetratricopeptide repeat protein [Promethearchaeota archaeon]